MPTVWSSTIGRAIRMAMSLAVTLVLIGAGNPPARSAAVEPPERLVPDVKTRALVTAIAAWVAREMNVPMAADLPRISVVERASIGTLRRKLAADSAPGPLTKPEIPQSAIIAFYNSTTRTIVLPRDWLQHGGPAGMSVLVHEMVHHFQFESKKSFLCPAEKEKEAFHIQEKWLGMFGSSLQQAFHADPLFIFVRSTCYF